MLNKYLNSFWIIIEKITYLFFYLFFIKKLSSSVDISTFGDFNLMIAQISIFLVLAKFGLTTITQKIFWDQRKNEIEVLSSLLLLKFFLFVLVGILFIVININSLNITYFIICLFLLSSLNELFIDFSFYKNKFKKNYLIITLINIFLITLLVLCPDSSELYIFSIFYVLNPFLSFIYFAIKHQIFLVLKRINLSFLFNFFKNEYKRILPYFISSFFVILILRIDVFLINLFYDKDDVGIYSASMRILELLFLAPMLFTKGIKSFLIQSSNEDYYQFIRKSIFYFFWGSLLIALTVYFFAFEIIMLIYDYKFYDSVMILSILCFALVPNALNFIINSWYMRENQQNIVLYLSIFSFFFISISNFFFLPLFHIKISAYIVVITFILNIFIFPLIFKQSRFIPFFILRSILGAK